MIYITFVSLGDSHYPGEKQSAPQTFITTYTTGEIKIKYFSQHQEGISPKSVADDIKQNKDMYLLCLKHKCDFLKVQT